MREDSNNTGNNQITVTATIKPTRVNTEILTFSFNLGPLKVVCIANVPEEGQVTAPAYIKFELNAPRPRKLSGAMAQHADEDDPNWHGEALDG